VFRYASPVWPSWTDQWPSAALASSTQAVRSGTLGVILDAELTVKPHIARVMSSCFYQLRRLKHVRHSIGQELTAQLVHAFVLSRLDYCNSVLAGLPKSTTDPLQRVQKTAAHLILWLRARDHVTAAMRQLHLLLVHQRIQHKLCTMMQCVHCGMCPVYLADTVFTIADNPTRSALCRQHDVPAYSYWDIVRPWVSVHSSTPDHWHITLCLQHFVT